MPQPVFPIHTTPNFAEKYTFLDRLARLEDPEQHAQAISTARMPLSLIRCVLSCSNLPKTRSEWQVSQSNFGSCSPWRQGQQSVGIVESPADVV